MRFLQSLRCLFLLFVLGLFGCATMPPELSTNNANVVTDYKSLSQAVSSSEVRLGGVIAGVKNLKDKTRVEVVNLPLTTNGKPDIGYEPKGRYIVYLNGFVDPVSLPNGRLISVLGKLHGTEMSMVDEYQAKFPVIDATGFHLWKVEQQVVSDPIGSFLRPCRSPFCHHDDFYQQRVIQVVK